MVSSRPRVTMERLSPTRTMSVSSAMRALGKSEAVINVIGSCRLYIARSVPSVVLCFVEVPVADKYDE